MLYCSRVPALPLAITLGSGHMQTHTLTSAKHVCVDWYAKQWAVETSEHVNVQVGDVLNTLKANGTAAMPRIVTAVGTSASGNALYSVDVVKVPKPPKTKKDGKTSKASKPAGKTVASTPTSELAQLLEQAAVLQAAIARLTSTPTTSQPVSTVASKPASPAQLAARQRFADMSRARAASKASVPAATSTPVVSVPVTTTSVDIPAQVIGEICVCNVGKATHVHHGASKLLDRTVRACRDCAKSLSGDDMVAALAARAS